jgi:hypothetical protein
MWLGSKRKIVKISYDVLRKTARYYEMLSASFNKNMIDLGNDFISSWEEDLWQLALQAYCISWEFFHEFHVETQRRSRLPSGSTNKNILDVSKRALQLWHFILIYSDDM